MAISVALYDIIETINDNNVIDDFSISSNKRNSSNRFDKKIALIIEKFAPYIIATSFAYWKINSNERLNIETRERLKRFLKNLIVSTNLEGDLDDIILLGRKVLAPYDRLEITRKEFESKNNIIFNDTSPEHCAAFGVTSKNQLPQNNILIKFIVNSVHIRMGIKIKSNELKILLIDIVNKRKGNK